MLLFFCIALVCLCTLLFARGSTVELLSDQASIKFGSALDVTLARTETGDLLLNCDLVVPDPADAAQTVSISSIITSVRALDRGSIPSLTAVPDTSEVQSYLAYKREPLLQLVSSPLISSYTHTLTTPPVGQAYYGGVYSPSNDRIYFVPYAQADQGGQNWHYIASVSGGVFSPALFAGALFNKF
jgi:hypothetical protein